MRINEIIGEWMIMPQTIKPMGLIRKPSGGFDFKNKGNNRANELDEGMKIANLVGQSIAHLEMYVELANDVKKDYFKTDSKISLSHGSILVPAIVHF